MQPRKIPMALTENDLPQHASLPPDDPKRRLVVMQAEDPWMPHIGLVGDTYPVVLKSEATAGRYWVIDMHIPSGGGPPPRRHDFEESFILLEGEMEATFRGVKSIVRAGDTDRKSTRLNSSHL